MYFNMISDKFIFSIAGVFLLKIFLSYNLLFYIFNKNAHFNINI